MSEINYQALRETAENATPGEWCTDDHYGVIADAGLNANYYIASCSGPDNRSNKRFIAAANPATVLALLGELETAKKRIAELESNEVREVGNQFLVVRHPGKTPVIKHCTGDPEEFLRKLIEQDPLVTIDIITHRYYGIGGQWVQDAVEYLHMMSDAGIRIKGE
ncbi:TPA: ead/Ea22-like family protein [Salmonella enterica]|uniref:Ead/Ea22-like family protein n=1 Tax=Salmonella enterica subsp. enterica serovar Agona TaxID=58095 RepID=A0A5W2FBK6_SALET|nr:MULTISPECIES: ead/Ea22-like family protein [Salmonella]EAA0899391.1 ead/Ea22-like family protein [Salmonella enterica subsp. enterica serovar Stanley]EAA4418017.1 ead/Ea22-like family protein [Salmonella enterica subsp. enterica serovar Oranienburg]EAB5476162.1 ead/Ea22-like family protein [Salmonella enterica subsp. enterica serovar Chester]EAC0195265.1 ead/Ea22-like family protein [Salmonella enterica subsp. enterica serovar Panama]EBH8234168.1 ead/Ea22-like family protein [Salmonella ent